MKVTLGNPNLPKDVIVNEVAHSKPLSIFQEDVSEIRKATNVSTSRTPVYALSGKSLYPKHYFGFLQNLKQVWAPRATSAGFWGVTLGFWAWYALIPQSNMVLRRIFLGEHPED
ncbi:hypothetical protein C9374_009090 [Naegleria lovaniensis]|uniref:Uncharacterized protein n=1 Tax=Naegleria lovaniensis TaxID=51637 RepID=A0AA88GDU1_NAELO|nr:uncharacterized protein C9374_009090 [Naegleria lovaniensis]KAG2377574.1 hypothetical protein C9374_009090 [Naegleria lovaniensis]